jgi:hypothetical protein
MCNPSRTNDLRVPDRLTTEPATDIECYSRLFGNTDSSEKAGALSVQVKVEMSDEFARKRHQRQHLKFCTTLLLSREGWVGGSIPSGRSTSNAERMASTGGHCEEVSDSTNSGLGSAKFVADILRLKVAAEHRNALILGM